MQFVAQNTRAGGSAQLLYGVPTRFASAVFSGHCVACLGVPPSAQGRSVVTYIGTGVQAMMCTAAKLLVRGLLLFFGMAVCLGPACASSAGGAADDAQDQQVGRWLIGNVPCAGC